MRSKKRKKSSPIAREAVSELELSQLGDGCVAYIKEMTSGEARKEFPTLRGISLGTYVFVVFAADGTPLVLTDGYSECCEYADEQGLEIANVH